METKIANTEGFAEFLEFLKGAPGKSFSLPYGLLNVVAEQTENFRPMPQGHCIVQNDWFAMSVEQRMDWRDRIMYPAQKIMTRLNRVRSSVEFDVLAVEEDKTPATATYEDLAYWICRVGLPKVLAEAEAEADWAKNYLRWNLDGIELEFWRKFHRRDIQNFRVKATYACERSARDSG